MYKTHFKNISIECAKLTAFLKGNLELVLKGFPEMELKDVFKVSYKISTNPEWLQDLILHKILLVNQNSKKMKVKKNDETCIFFL